MVQSSTSWSCLDYKDVKTIKMTIQILRLTQKRDLHVKETILKVKYKNYR